MTHATRFLRSALGLITLLVLLALPARAQTIFINEIHYDNVSTDVGEAIEIAGPAGTDLTGYKVYLYRPNGTAYDSTALSALIPDQQNGYGTIYVSYPANGLQNGNGSGIVLATPDRSVIQFLSYQGTSTAVNGPAAGMTSTDIGVREGSSTPVGHSLQLVGAGTRYEDFTWAPAKPNTFGDINDGQTFLAPEPDPDPDPDPEPDHCKDPATMPSYDGGYVLNNAGTKALVKVNVPMGGAVFEFYKTRNLVIGAPTGDVNGFSAFAGVTRTGAAAGAAGDVTFAFAAASPTTVYFPIEAASSSNNVAFFLLVTDACGRTMDVDPEFALSAIGETLEGFALSAQPNVLADRTTLRFSLEEAGPARLAVYDMLGREVTVVANDVFGAGEQAISLEASSLSSGLYFVRLEAGGRALTQTITIAR